MSMLDALRYHASATVAGQAFLRWERIQLERKMKRPGFWKDPHLEAPLAVSPRLKELISRHYLKGRFANPHLKVAWVTSGAPIEFLIALGFFPIYPENHGAVCGIRRKAEALSTEAENAGYSRDICSYARTDIGSVLSGKTPVGKLPKPDLLVCCTNICQTVLLWYRVLAHHFDVPLVVIDTPFLYGEAGDHDIEFVKKQIEEAIAVAERVAGRTLAPKTLETVTRRSKDATDLWRRVIELGKQKPSPITAFDEFIHMAPIVEMRGEEFTVDYYRALVDELEGRARLGLGALKHEKKRLIWDNLPIWHRVRWLGDALAERGVAMVTSTYTNAWGELTDLVDPERPLDSAARVYLHPILNRGTGHKLDVMKRMVREFSADGVILHSDRSCKPYSIGQVDQRERLGRDAGVPALLLEADHNDPRTFSEEQARARLDAFLEMLGV